MGYVRVDLVIVLCLAGRGGVEPAYDPRRGLIESFAVV